MEKISFMLMCLFLMSCQELIEPKDPEPDERVEQLQEEYESELQRADSLEDENGWLNGEDCDGMIWTGKYASVRGVDGVDIEVTEFADQPGRFGRRPPPRCWNPEEGDVGAKSTWSRDMAVGGFLPWAWRTKNLKALQRHVKYGKKANWKMGEPLADGRVIYTPQLIGLVYEVIYALGGEDNPSRAWPSTYPKLKGYEAHLQTMSIWLRCSVKAGDGEDHGKISKVMKKRLEENFKAEPKSALYAYVLGLFTGDMGPALDLLLDPKKPMPGYVRCKGHCELAEWLFVADLVLESYQQ